MAWVAERPDDTGEDAFGDALKPGTQLLRGQFVIEAFLNAGGFGITYLARDSLERRVVLKECFPAYFCRRSDQRVAPKSRQRVEEFRSVVRLFLQEAFTLARLDHPGIVKVHQVFEDNDTAYIAMDHVEGPDLLETVEGTAPALSPVQIMTLLVQVLDALGYVHAQGVLHRDISPDNILLDRATGRPIMIDFGAAKKDVTRKSRAVSGLRVVKDGYSPQEFYITGSTQTPSSDLYALAASFSHLITQEAPRTSQERLSSIANRQGDPQVPLSGRVGGYPAPFLAAIDKAMAIFPRDRLQSVAEWLDMLGDLAGPVAAVQPPAAPPAPAPVAPPVAVAAALPPNRMQGARDLLVSAAAASVLLAGLASLANDLAQRRALLATAPPAVAVESAGLTRGLRLPYLADPADPGLVAARLPWSPDWVTPGTRIVEINGTPMQAGSDLQALMAGQADLSAASALRVIFGHVTGNGNDVLRKAESLPVVDLLTLAPGLDFAVVTTPTGPQTVLVSQPLPGQGDLQPGDVLVVYAPTGETLGTATALLDILHRETARDVATFGFAIQRAGRMISGSFRLQGEG